MTDLPTGTVTFLFTDIEGSTRLLNQLGGRFTEVLETHQRLLREAFKARGGIEVHTEGDSFFVVFPSAPEAIGAAVDAQRALASHPWPEDGVVRVRMGLHTGEGVRGGDDYVGIDVHRAARIAAAGHGGQVLLSEATRALVDQTLPGRCALKDLGEHRLKDLAHPEHLFQLVVEGLFSDFPAIRSLDARPNNLPVQLTRFIGRDEVIRDVLGLLEDARLLTLTGPGGTGKTRLSLQVAAELLLRFADGAFFIDLSSITDPALVPSAIAEALGVAEEAGRPFLDTLKDHLREKETLLVIDNFEQVLDAAPGVEDLLAAAPGVKILVTSRAVLHLYGEREYPVPPLALPDPARLPDLETLSQYESVALFIDRALASNPGFRVTNENAPAVAEICARLDGLPLAIELAAARIKLLTPQAMLTRLEQRLPLLTSGGRTLPERQRTLRGAIEWSYEHLGEAEQRLFTRLSVFVGGCTLEATESVAGPGLDLDVLDGLATLVDDSLLRRTEAPGGELRFVMLETIREYAAERFLEGPDLEVISRRHAEFFAALAVEAEPHFTGEDQKEWLDRFEREHDNARAALKWALRSGEAEIGLQMGAALWRFWHQRSHLVEGRDVLEQFLAHPAAAARTAARSKALGAAGSLAYWQNDFDTMKRYYDESLAIAREVGDRTALAEALFNASFVPMLEGRAEDARPIIQEGAGVYREIGDRKGEANILVSEAVLLWRSGDLEGSVAFWEEGVAKFRELGDRFLLADTLAGLGHARQKLGDHEAAHEALGESLGMFREAENLSGIAMILDSLAEVALKEGDPERAVRLAGAADEMKETVGGGAPPSIALIEDIREGAKGTLDADVIERLWQEGRAMGTDKAVAYALREAGEQSE